MQFAERPPLDVLVVGDSSRIREALVDGQSGRPVDVEMHRPEGAGQGDALAADCVVVDGASLDGRGTETVETVANRSPGRVVLLVETFDRPVPDAVTALSRSLPLENPALFVDRVSSLAGRTRRLQRYRALCEGVAGPLSVHDPESGRLLAANDAFRSVLGDRALSPPVRPERLRASPDGDVSDDELGALVDGGSRSQSLVDACRAAGPDRAATAEWPLATGAGTRWLESECRLVTAGADEVVVVSSTDVTERRESEQSFRRLLTESGTAVAVHDEDGTMRTTSDAFADLMGHEDRTAAASAGLTALDHAGDERPDESLRARIERVYETLVAETAEWPTTVDGERRLFRTFLVPGQVGGDQVVLTMWNDVTERERLEHTYRDLFESVADGLVVHDPETGEILDTNERFAEMNGYDRAALLEKSMTAVLPSSSEYSAERAREMVRRAVEEGPQLFEWRNVRPDGEQFPVEVHLSTVDIRGEQRVLAAVRDITERKRREREYEQIFDSVNDTIAVNDPETGEITAVNRAMCEATGYDRETLRNLSPETLRADHPDQDVSPERASEILERVADGETVEPYEIAVETADGDTLWLEVNPTHAEIGGKPRVLVIARDITERRHREREYEQVYNGVQDAISIVDPETFAFVDANRAFLDLFGFEDREAVRAERVERLSPADGGVDADEMRAVHRRVAESGEQELAEWRVETADDERLWVSARVAPAVIGGEAMTIAIQRDVTDRKRREQRLEVFNRVLRHNLRNRLDVIRGHAELLADRTDGDSAGRIIAATDDLATTSNRARTIDRLMTDSSRPTAINLRECVAETIAEVGHVRGDVTVSNDVPAGTTLVTDLEAVRAVLESTLENAITYADSSVRVTATEDPDRHVLRIEDDGPGIPQGELASLEAGTETDLQHGRGLGLWQLKWAVDRLNGSFAFDTGTGTTVEIAIPDETR